MDYYFLVASLPMLAFNAPPALSGADFLARCREHLTPSDLDELRAVWERDAVGGRSRFARGWQNAELLMRNAVARERGQHVGRDPQPHVRPAEGCDVRAAARVQDAFGRPTPLEREMELDRLRWELAGELAGLDPFALDAILAYAARLKIAERWAALDADRGRRRVEELVGQLTSSVEV